MARDGPLDYSAASMTHQAAASGLSIFQHRDFRFYLLARLCAVLAVQIESVAIGWQVYELTGSALALGYTGLD